MPNDPHAADYRRRATELRRVAARLDDSPALSLHQWAGTDTWRSPRAEECRTQLSADQSRLRSAADELRTQAWRYERHADALDAAAAAAAVMQIR